MSTRPPGVTSILQAVEKRGETDTRPSYFVHVVLPLLLVAAAILIVGGAIFYAVGTVPESVDQIPDQQFGVLVTAAILGVLAVVASAVLTFRGWYLLITRRNDHLARDRVLRQGLLDLARPYAESAGATDAGEHLETMQRLHNEALLDENERPAVVHILLYVFTQGLWGLYVLYFLVKDLPQHARRQARFVREARGVLEAAGEDPDQLPPVEPMDERSYLASLALWIFVPIAGQLVVTWWLYQDPEEHFDRQWAHEDALVDVVEEAQHPQHSATPGPETAPGGSPEPDEGEGGEAAPGEGTDEEPAEEEQEFTVWACSACETKFKVPPKRPVRVTCKSCGNKEILEE
jgi:hypothetical protein